MSRAKRDRPGPPSAASVAGAPVVPAVPAVPAAPREVSLNELEDAINHWRGLRPSIGVEQALSPEVDALASVYAAMIFQRLHAVSSDQVDAEPLRLLELWRGQRPLPSP